MNNNSVNYNAYTPQKRNYLSHIISQGALLGIWEDVRFLSTLNKIEMTAQSLPSLSPDFPTFSKNFPNFSRFSDIMIPDSRDMRFLEIYCIQKLQF